MAAGVSLNLQSNKPSRRATRDPWWVKWTIIFVGVVFLLFFLVLPLTSIFVEAFRKGFGPYFKSFQDPAAISAIKLTLLVAAIAVPLNLLFGLIASWCIAKFNFIGKSLLLTLIDLPFAVSPVISGLIYVLLFGPRAGLVRAVASGARRQDHLRRAGHCVGNDLRDVSVRRARIDPADGKPGHAGGRGRARARRGRLKTFWLVTLPNVKWALLYGVILCNARAMGEFGAVSVVSGHIRGKTNTLPLHVEVLYNEYNFVAAFAVASLLAILGLVTLVVKAIVERRAHA